MRGKKSPDLLAIFDFLYFGVANVFQENLNSFLAIAEELQLKGLMGKTDDDVKDFVENENFLPPKLSAAINTHRKIKRQNPKQNGTLVNPSNFFGDFEELAQTIIRKHIGAKYVEMKGWVAR